MVHEMVITAARPLRQAEIARRMGVTRNYLHQLRQEHGFPPPVMEGVFYDIDAVRRFLRERALRRHPEARYCIACGGELVATT